MTVNEYAQHSGRSQQAVDYALWRGYITRDESGKIDSDLADLCWAERVDPALSKSKAVRAGESSRGAWTEKRAAAVDASKFVQAQTIERNITFAQARATKEEWAAKLKELEFEAKSGALISRQEVEIAAETAGRRLRDALFSLPARLATQLAAESDPFLIHQMLEAELRQLLDEMLGGRRPV